MAETQDALARANANGTVLGDFWVHRIDAAATPVLLIVNDLQAAGVVTLWLQCASFEGLHGEPLIYKTPHHPDYQKDRHQRMAHVALHTAAAPSYYPGVEDDGYVMLDGGIWANNPVINAVFDALACYDVPRENIRVLSIGTGEQTFTVDEKARNGGAADWAFMRSFAAASRAQSRNALGQAYLLVGKNSVTRIDPPETDNPIALDDVELSLRELPHVARSLVEGSGHYVQLNFLQDRADPFVRCPMR